MFATLAPVSRGSTQSRYVMSARSFLWLLVLSCAPVRLDGALMPNRGTQLFVLIQDSAAIHVIAMTRTERAVLQSWDHYSPRYDFVSAMVTQLPDGAKVRFTRYVMKSDYVSRVESTELVFPYAKQAHYSFFDIGTITGFYRNSPSDFDVHELGIKPKRLTSRSSRRRASLLPSSHITKTLQPAATRALVSRS
jgi:hypothetical protein